MQTKTLEEQQAAERDYYLGKSDKVPNTTKSIKQLRQEYLEREKALDEKIQKNSDKYNESIKDRAGKQVKEEPFLTVVTPGVLGAISQSKPVSTVPVQATIVDELTTPETKTEAVKTDTKPKTT